MLSRGLVLALTMAVGCPMEGQGTSAPIPPAEIYDAPSDFQGVWIGEVDGQAGSLAITSLGGARYRGFFEADDVELEYVLLLTQDMVDRGGEPIAANRTRFTWQDGHGGRGEGWLLINAEDSALTGAFGEHGELDRTWTFIRVE